MITDNLLSTKPFEFSAKNKSLFIESLIECAGIHCEGNAFINYLYNKYQFDINALKFESDLAHLPYTFVNLFKHHRLLTGAEEDIVLTLGSSGTGGQRSQIYLNQQSLNRVKKLAFSIHKDLGITSEKKYNYLCFTYDPEVANDLGTAFTDELLTSFTDKNEVFYTFKHNGSDFYFDETATVEKLIEFSKSRYSTRILGFPAFLYKIVNKYKLSLKFDEDSWIQTGGGWKGESGIEIPKDQFRSMMQDALGINKRNNRDLFGMVEHGIPYVDCSEGKLRVPNYSRVLVRDPKTMEVLPNGECGLLQFICTYNTSYPAFNLLTSDWGVKDEDEFSEYIELKGRAGITKNKGCAIKAAQML